MTPESEFGHQMYETTLPPITPITSDYIGYNVPIDIDRFEEGASEELRATGRTNAEEVLAFLSRSPDKAFTPKEIYEATDVTRGSVGVVLSRLEERGLVRHRGEYWAVADVEDIDKTLGALSTARTVTDRLGPEDPDEWGPGVDETGDDG